MEKSKSFLASCLVSCMCSCGGLNTIVVPTFEERKEIHTGSDWTSPDLDKTVR